MYNKNNVDTIILEVKKITNDFQNILDKNDAINLGIFKQSGNGSGDRQQICKIFYTTYIYYILYLSYTLLLRFFYSINVF